jgi:uncharacterized phage-associated protein
MYDARQIANFLLDEADGRRLQITHLALQKLVYFCHGLSYSRFGHPLILNRLEAWKRGPVIRELYFSFNKFGDLPITNRAKLLNVQTRTEEVIAYDFPAPICGHLEEVLRIYGPLSPGRLVAMTHEKGTPWERTISQAENSANVGMHIDEELIRQFFAPDLAKRECTVNVSGSEQVQILRQ